MINGIFYEQGSAVICRRLVSPYLAAFLAAVYYHKALFGVRLGANGAKRSAAGICSIPGVDVHVYRPQAVGAVVSRRISERLYLPTAVETNEAVIVF